MIAPSASRSSLRTFRGAVLAALVTATVSPADAQSLWSVRAGSLVTDNRASRAGDLVTILVDEASTADKTSETKLKRDSSFQSQVDLPHFDYPKWLNNFLLNLKASGTGTSNYDGSGSTTRADRATAQITAKVMRVLDNGNFLIEGRRIIVVHDETQTIVLSGVVRPQDVAADNTVRSAFVADAEVRIEGRGCRALASRMSDGSSAYVRTRCTGTGS
jgi:flagellar L-ring protein precursor FlgH